MKRARIGSYDASMAFTFLGAKGTVPLSSNENRDSPQYVTFVNPQAVKGVYVFARIAHELAHRRPGIPLLVVEGRSQTRVLEQTGIDPKALPNLYRAENTPDPRNFYAVTKLLLMPSLWNESFGLVAAEGMLNGIPVLASTRGALPEIVGDAGFLFDIPARYTPTTTLLPTTAEVEPWVETIIRLWDDAAAYCHASQAARARAQRWLPEQAGPRYSDFFSTLHPQPGPPIVPKQLEVVAYCMDTLPTVLRSI